MAEVITLVDDQDKVVGTKDREELKDSDRWRAVTIWVEDTDGRILIAKRGPQKQYEPNLWEPGASGTVTYPEAYEVAAIRELDEEVGIKVDKLPLLDILFYKKPFGSRAMGVFKAVVDKGTPIELQAKEVADAKWVERSGLKKVYETSPDKFVSDFGIMMDYFLNE